MKVSTSSERLKTLLNITGDTQNDMAKKTKIPKSSISHYVNGEREPRQDKLTMIAEAYNVNPAWLMGIDVPMESITSLQNKMVDTRIDYFLNYENGEEALNLLEIKYQKLREKYDKVREANEFIDLWENASPEARTLVENFLKSSQQ